MLHQQRILLNNNNNNTKNSSTSSGVASTTVSVTSSSSDSSDTNTDDVSSQQNTAKTDSHTINTIKYNAKTNILHHQQPPPRASQNTNKKLQFLQHAKPVDYLYAEGSQSTQMDRKKLINLKNGLSQDTAHNYASLRVNYCTLLKTNNSKNIAKEYFRANNTPGNCKTISFGANKNYSLVNSSGNHSNGNHGNSTSSCKFHARAPRVMLDSLLEANVPLSSANTSCSQKTATTSADSLPNTGGDSSGISLNVDTSSDTHERSFDKNSSSFKTQHTLQNPVVKMRKPSPETECFNWLNDIGSPSITPDETASSASSTYAPEPPLPMNQQLSSSSSSLYSSKISPLPFPTTHFSFFSDPNAKPKKHCSTCIEAATDEATVTPTSSSASSTSSTSSSTSSTSSSASTASSSSGCSSLENNQYYSTKPGESCKFVLPTTLVTSDDANSKNYSDLPATTRLPSQRNSMCNVPNNSQQSQQFLTYKPILKTSVNAACNSSNGGSLKKVANTTFRTSKIDFV